MQLQLQQLGALGIAAGGAAVAAGGTVAAASAAVGFAGAVTGNVPAAAVGALGSAAGIKVAVYGTIIQAGGALLAFAGGASLRQLFKDGSDALVNALPLKGIARFGLKKALDMASNLVPDARVCR